MYWSDKYEAIHIADELAISAEDSDIKNHAKFLIENERGYMKFALKYPDGATLWVYQNESVTVKPEYIK